MELLACNVGNHTTDTTWYEQKYPVLVWPNPAVSVFSVQTGADYLADQVTVYNLTGQKIKAEISRKYPRRLDINLNGYPAGVYLVRMESEGKVQTAKVMLVSP
ncbi:MAG TPA: T9SS type A sorting domain-containing protein, partial [Prolixibacteraceae bacterium]|nr:T9SS type A sorting domain-containing protein [Prolixibacteraceae bacterium]